MEGDHTRPLCLDSNAFRWNRFTVFLVGRPVLKRTVPGTAGCTSGKDELAKYHPWDRVLSRDPEFDRISGAPSKNHTSFKTSHSWLIPNFLWLPFLFLLLLSQTSSSCTVCCCCYCCSGLAWTQHRIYKGKSDMDLTVFIDGWERWLFDGQEVTSTCGSTLFQEGWLQVSRETVSNYWSIVRWNRSR